MTPITPKELYRSVVDGCKYRRGRRRPADLSAHIEQGVEPVGERQGRLFFDRVVDFEFKTQRFCIGQLDRGIWSSLGHSQPGCRHPGQTCLILCSLIVGEDQAPGQQIAGTSRSALEIGDERSLPQGVGSIVSVPARIMVSRARNTGGPSEESCAGMRAVNIGIFYLHAQGGRQPWLDRGYVFLAQSCLVDHSPSLLETSNRPFHVSFEE